MQTTTSRAQRADAARREHERRHRLAQLLADPHGGVVTRIMLRDAGMTRGQVQVEVDRGLWRAAGRHTVCVTGGVPAGAGLWWRALWESGERSVLDGTTSLMAAGRR